MAIKKFFDGELEIIDIDALAKQLDVHKVTLLRKIRDKKLFAQRIGRSFWVSKDSLKNFLDDGLSKATAKPSK